MDVEAFATNLNQAWMDGDLVRLGGFFHDDVIMFMPAGMPALKGRESMLASYSEFLNVAKVHEFEITNVDVHPFNSIVMCHLHFRVAYEMESERYEESGTDIYAIDVSETPIVVWRTQILV